MSANMENKTLAKFIVIAEDNENRLKIVAERLRSRIDNIGNTKKGKSVANLLKKSLNELQLVHEQFEASLKRVLDYEKTQQVIEQQKEGLIVSGRLETKLDTVTSKLDQIAAKVDKTDKSIVLDRIDEGLPTVHHDVRQIQRGVTEPVVSSSLKPTPGLKCRSNPLVNRPRPFRRLLASLRLFGTDLAS
jgi:paraquat-inducible protein B